jgi:hypothetical protein
MGHSTFARRTKAHRRAVVLLFLALLVASVAQAPVSAAQAPQGPPPDPAAGTPMKIITYNVKGAIRARENERVFWMDPESAALTLTVADRIVAERPQIVMFQEICESQVEMIIDRLEQEGYPMFAPVVGSPTRPDVRGLCPDHPDALPPPTYGDRFGQAILTAGPSEPIPAPGIPAFCAEATGPPPVRACTFHTEPAPNGPDFSLVASRLALWAAQGPLILAGDFNATPDQMLDFYSERVQGGFGRFYEVDMCTVRDSGCTSPVTGGGVTFSLPFMYKKIDYILVDDTHFEPIMTGRVERPACDGEYWALGWRPKECSDHAMLIGEVRLLAAGGGEFPTETFPDAGTPVWAVYLAVAESFDAPAIAAAKTAKLHAGYVGAELSLNCDQGASAALGVESGAAVAVYFQTQAEAEQAQRAFEARGDAVAAIAQVQPICLD